MDKLNKDEMFTLSLHLDLPELYNLCKSYRKFNEKICKDQTVWQRKIARDFPEFKFEDLILELKQRSFKEIYTLLYAKKNWKMKESINEIYTEDEIELWDKDIPDYFSLPNLKYLWINNDELHVIPEHVDSPI